MYFWVDIKLHNIGMKIFLIRYKNCKVFIPVKYNHNNVLLITGTTGPKGTYYGLIMVDWFEKRDVGYQIVKTCLVH